MEPYAELFRIAKILLAEPDDDQTAERLLQRVVEHTGADRAFIVVREDGSFQEKFGIRYDRESLTPEQRRFSRTLVREAVQSRRLIYIPSLIDDSRLAMAKSVHMIGKGSALVAPLHDGAEVYGVIYLENRERLDSFSEADRSFVGEFAEVAGLFMRRAVERQALVERTRNLEGDLFAQHDFKGIVTRDPRMLKILEMIGQVAGADAPVLVRGETGTGKELIARAVHVNSPRREQPLITVHCSALPKELIEAELFGHVAGAFTDAKRERTGRLASAHQGTVFLDEVGEIPLEVQAKLLRFLQFGEIQKVGSDEVRKVDVRIVAATHRDLRQMSRDGGFREDLYFRLKVLELELPPLRERQGDLMLLLDHFLQRQWRRAGEQPRWTPAATQALAAYDYPGNIRELAHLVERACLLARGPQIDVDLLPPEVTGATPQVGGRGPAFTDFTRDGLNAAREAAVEAVELEFVQTLLERTGGNVSQASRESGMHRSYLQKLLARHRQALDREEGKQRPPGGNEGGGH